MKNRVKNFIALLLAAAFALGLPGLSAAAESPGTESVEASSSNGVVSVSGSAPSGVMAVAVLLYKGGDLLRLETAGVIDGGFALEIAIQLPAGEYTVKAARYEGGAFFARGSFSVTPPPAGGEAQGPSPYSAEVSGGGGLPVNVDLLKGSASVALGAMAKGVAEGARTVVSLPLIPGVRSYSVGLSAASLSGGAAGALTVKTPAWSIEIPGNMLSGTNLTGSAEIAVCPGDRAGLSDDLRAAVGDRPFVSLSLSIDGRQTAWSNPRAPVRVSIPYAPTAAELQSPESIVIWYIDGSGNAAAIPNGRYDPATGTVSFSTTHFSGFAVAHNEVGFSDVAAEAWYGRAVSFIAARGITFGTGDGSFSPGAALTRGQLVVLLMRAYGIGPEESPADNFADAGDAYYTGYLAAAKRLGISAGIGGNLFSPDRAVTRQEMFTLLYNALEATGALTAESAGKKLSDFADEADIAPWARGATAALAEAGKISGRGGELAPASGATRAEIAQMLFGLLY